MELQYAVMRDHVNLSPAGSVLATPVFSAQQKDRAGGGGDGGNRRSTRGAGGATGDGSDPLVSSRWEGNSWLQDEERFVAECGRSKGSALSGGGEMTCYIRVGFRLYFFFFTPGPREKWMWPALQLAFQNDQFCFLPKTLLRLQQRRGEKDTKTHHNLTLEEAKAGRARAGSKAERDGSNISAQQGGEAAEKGDAEPQVGGILDPNFLSLFYYLNRLDAIFCFALAVLAHLQGPAWSLSGCHVSRHFGTDRCVAAVMLANGGVGGIMSDGALRGKGAEMERVENLA